jgi:hypothetical protein
MDPMILACLTGVAAVLGVAGYVVRSRRLRSGK